MESHQADKEVARAGPAEAYEALLQVEQMRQIALRRALPPRWLGIVVAILTGSLLGAQVADAPPFVNALLLAGVAITLGTARRTLLAIARRSSYGITLPVLARQIGAIVVIMAVCVGGRIAFVGYGMTWAPLASAVGTTATIYLLFEFKVAQYRASLELEERQ